jgi:uncharacterized coiled-coil protein SlyX
MPVIDDKQQRLDKMESGLSHQDLAIQALSDNAARQWEVIEQLEAALQRLEDKVKSLESGSSSESADEPPPHY